MKPKSCAGYCTESIVQQLSRPTKNLSPEEKIRRLYSEVLIVSNYKIKRLTINGIGGRNCDKITTTKKEIRERLAEIEDVLGDEYNLEDVAWKLEIFDDLLLKLTEELERKNKGIEDLNTRIIELHVQLLEEELERKNEVIEDLNTRILELHTQLLGKEFKS